MNAGSLNGVLALDSPEGRAALARWAGERTLYAFDFDGTLAPIVEHPDDARMSELMSCALSRLVERVPVAVVTGRALADVEARIPQGVRVVGNHGNEGLAFTTVDRIEASALCERWMAQLERIEWEPGVVLEDKTISLTLHYRASPDRARAEAHVRAVAAALEPAPRVIDGKCVLNLLPSESFTKREALRALVSEANCTHAVFVGDDVTDEYVFVDAPSEWLTVRVEPDNATAARWFVSTPDDVCRLVSDFADLIGQRRS